ncbi:hypothetical protein L7F22_037380 [Adiantum nelumboides]|nr:hypothetical protein [Adiantum nelumboides]
MEITTKLPFMEVGKEKGQKEVETTIQAKEVINDDMTTQEKAQETQEGMQESFKEEDIEAAKSPQKEKRNEQEISIEHPQQTVTPLEKATQQPRERTSVKSCLIRSTIRLHLAESVYFSVLECESAYALWQKFCNTYAKDTISNKVFMMQKLFNLCLKESASVANHINDFDPLFAQIRAQRINIDDEMKAIFLLCSLPPSWDIFCIAVSNSSPNDMLVYIDVTSSLLSKEMHCKAMGSLHHDKAHYVQKDGK